MEVMTVKINQYLVGLAQFSPKTMFWPALIVRLSSDDDTVGGYGLGRQWAQSTRGIGPR